MREHHFLDSEIKEDPILRFFDYSHLPTDLRKVSIAFAELAEILVNELPRSAERTMAFRKLLEAKDCAVRGALLLP